MESGKAHLTSTDPVQELLVAFGLTHSAFVENRPVALLSPNSMKSAADKVVGEPEFGIKLKLGISFAFKY
jgi:hypothetical protein